MAQIKLKGNPVHTAGNLPEIGSKARDFALRSRAVVVLDENNKVLYREQVPEVSQEPNYDAALAQV